MNSNRIKQMFVEFARALPLQEGTGLGFEKLIDAGPQAVSGPLLIRGSLVLRNDAASQYFTVLEGISSLACCDGTWSRSSVDDLLAESTFHVVHATAEQWSDIVKTQADRIVTHLKAEPDKWYVDTAISGAWIDCAGITFGKLELLSDAVTRFGSSNEEKKITAIFARVCVKAIDAKSALHSAASVVDRHLATLNTLCSWSQPSFNRFYRGQPGPFIHESIQRVRKYDDNSLSTRFGNQITEKAVRRAELDELLKSRGGTAVSSLLVRDDTYARRMVTAYVTAGAACVEDKSQLAFLLFAIALECLILGNDNKSEITYQLSIRVAHLLASSIEARRSISAQVNRLYRLRSAIVHAGEDEVAETDLGALRQICLLSLHRLTVDSAFASMNDSDGLDRWFNNQMLGGTQM